MNNLRLLHCARGKVDGGQTCRFITIDTLTPAVYLLCGRTMYCLDQHRRISLDVDLVTENVLQSDGSDTVIAMEFLADLQQICICTSQGNIVTFDPLIERFDTVACTPARLAASCWSPDFEILTLVTESDTILMINRDYEVINELELHPADFGTDDLITVGWGKKETQFHGSEGKQAAKAKVALEATDVLDWDDKKARISWRGDGQYFSVSAVDPSKGRTIRVWSREGVHCSTNERVDGAGQCLAWKPSGSLIATSQTKPNECRVIFYERNGLRHGEFALSFDAADCQVRELAWNRESTILAVWLRSSVNAYLQLYTTSNYHWYCKQTYSFSLDNGPTAWCWDPDQANTLHVAFANGVVASYVFAFVVHRNTMKDDHSLVAVVDGKKLYVTDFRQAVIPPPMCQCTIVACSFINEVTFMNGGEGRIACLTDNGRVVVVGEGEAVSNGSNSPHLVVLNTTELLFNDGIRRDFVYHFHHLLNGDYSYVLSVDVREWSFIIAEPFNQKEGDSSRRPYNYVVRSIPDGAIFQVVPNQSSADSLAILEMVDGSFRLLNDQRNIDSCSFMTKPLSSVAWHVEAVVVDGKLYVISLNERFQLAINSAEVSNDVTSFCLTTSFLLFTTITHHMKCLPFEAFHHGLGPTLLSDIEMRAIERGAKLVAAVGSEAKVVLQMPRGNLETIYPRALVLAIAKSLLNKFQYREALLLMRRNRVNLNLLYDHSPKDFLANTTDFVNQINDSTLLNLFVSDLKNEDVTETMYPKSYSCSKPASNGQANDKVNRVCEHLRAALEKAVPAHKYCTSILTALVKMSPSQLDSALRVVKDFRDSSVDGKVIEEALLHLLYYVDANRLFNVALGTYDFDLVLMVAEKSQKDPKEFLPFLQKLRSLAPAYGKYKIDVHLSRFEKALPHLLECTETGLVKFDEFVDFVKEHHLYTQAMKLLPVESADYKAVCLSLGDYLVSQRKYDEAAVSFQIGGNAKKAVENYTKALNWKMALGLSCKTGMEAGEVADLCDGLSRRLKDQRCFKDAALIEHEFLKDTKRCVGTLLDGGHWEEAVFRIYQSADFELVNELLVPALKANVTKGTELIEKQRATFCQHKNRLALVRAQKRQRLREINEKRELDDAMTEASTETGSVITRSSMASSRTMSSRAKRTKKLERKKYSLKEGNPYEDLGLLKELSEIVRQLNEMQGDTCSLLRTVAQYGLHAEGQRLQTAFKDFQDVVRSSMTEIWPDAIDLGMLPGPIKDMLVGENATAEDAIDRLCTIVDSRMKIKLDEHLVPPKVNSETAWTLSLFS